MSGPVLSHAQRISLASRQSSMIQSQYSTLFLKDLVELLVWSVTYVNLKKEANYTKPPRLISRDFILGCDILNFYDLIRYHNESRPAGFISKHPCIWCIACTPKAKYTTLYVYVLQGTIRYMLKVTGFTLLVCQTLLIDAGLAILGGCTCRSTKWYNKTQL